ncbi:MAG TPA: COX15/CtaA family protein [Thermomicrobiales bacterium]|jgi:cytochrome c oxidase assembly protein subunit 15|nr:COX15/CtaA family protein [Thermomicrobiales bacterium]
MADTSPRRSPILRPFIAVGRFFERKVRALAVITALGMFLVLLMGANVTATGSGEGCGNHWPLCHGSFLPADTFESMVEYSHRFVTGIEGLLVVATAIGAWRVRKTYPVFTLLVPVMVLFLVIQALMGAAAVKWPQSAEVMALHFGISLVCLAAAALIARIVTEARRDRFEDHLRLATIRARHIAPAGLRWLAVTALVFSVVTAYLGAYVRHTGYELACLGWPTCEGQLVHGLTGPAGIHYNHRLSAVVITLMVVALLWWTWRLRSIRPDLFGIAAVAMVVVIGQSVVGGLIVLTNVQILTTLAHAGLMGIFFVAMCDLVRCTWPARRPADRPAMRVAMPQPAGD